MVARRHVMGGTLLAGLAGLMMPRSAAATERSSQEDGATARAVDRLRDVIEKQGSACDLGPCGPVASIRAQQKVFLRANHKFPDYIDVGVDAWEAVYDWHVKNAQEIQVNRLSDGRYGIRFMFTIVVLRDDQTPAFIGWGYDAR